MNDHRTIALAAALALLLVLSLAPGASAVADPETIAQGKRVYETQCAGCHGEQGNGKGAAADMFAKCNCLGNQAPQGGGFDGPLPTNPFDVPDHLSSENRRSGFEVFRSHSTAE